MTRSKVRELARDRSVTSFKLGLCKRCGHSPDWHRLDDSKNVSCTVSHTERAGLGPTKGER